MLSGIAFAQADCGSFKFGGCAGLFDLLSAGINTMVTVAWFLAIIFIAYGGILYITSAGEKTKAETAQKVITNAVIGVVIALILSTLSTIVSNFVTGRTQVTASTFTLPPAR